MPKAAKVREKCGIFARTGMTSGTIDEIFGGTDETSKKTVVTFVKIGESYGTTDGPEPVRKNWRRIDVTSATIGMIYGRTIEICDTIAKTGATTDGTCGVIWPAEDTAAVSRGFDTTEPVEDSASAGFTYAKLDCERVMSCAANRQGSITSSQLSTGLIFSKLGWS